MKQYYCKLVDYRGFRKESFYRDGESAQDVLNSLQMFQYPKGTWTIEYNGDYAEGES